MKIVILVLRFLPSYPGGTEIATHFIAQHLVKQNHEVHVITTLDKKVLKINEQNNYYVHRVKTIELPLLRSLIYSIKTLSLVKRIKPDIVHSQNASINTSGLACILIRKFLKIPYVAWGRGSDIYSPIYESPFKKTILKNSDATIALTNDMKKSVQKICDIPVFVISNGIDVYLFNNNNKNQNRERLEINNDEKIILFVGRLIQIKGLTYLITAMKIIHDKSKKIRLLIVGYGEEKTKLEKLVKKLDLNTHITFTDKVPHELIREYMAAADIFVLPSLSEGFPVVLLEAMASGLPIVATNITGISEIIKDGENGLLVKPMNSNEIAEKVLMLLNDNKLAKLISENNKKEAQKYSWERTVEKLERVYLEMVSRK